MIDIVTLSWKRPTQLLSCIQSIFNNTNLDNIGTIYIIINEFNSDYHCFGYPYPCELIKLSTNEGVVARNHALRLSKAEYIAQIDDDVEVLPGWDERALEALQGDVKGVGQDGSWVIPDLSNYCLPDKKPKPGDYCDVLAGYCWVFKNERFLYDEAFGMHWHEETDLQFQMRVKGYRFKVLDRLCIHHHQGKPNNWMEYHDLNIKRIQGKWFPRKPELHLEEPQ